MHHRPLDAQEFPRFSGIRTYMRAPHTTDLAGVDAAVVGVPFDTATSYRSGTRFGPEGIRSASALIRNYHPVHDVNIVDSYPSDGGTSWTATGYNPGIGPASFNVYAICAST